ncbi:MAG TPA: hypothetical protein EYQ50_21085 [Verrucomicrobiales bacterium]|nr:hypothetical protein [Verrucomicrobiales bacterium]HIL71734.1 hypothetical protein [Verrucomicrobiota bacterium]
MKAEKKVFKRTDYSTRFAAFVVPDRQSAEVLSKELRSIEIVSSVRSLADLEVYEDQGVNLDLPASFLSTLHSEDGKYAVYAYPKGNIWDVDIQNRFVDRMKQIDSKVTGMPVIGKLMLQKTKAALEITGSRAFLLIVIFVVLQFRNIPSALLALLPSALTWIWMPYLMHVFGLTFNPLNVMALPVVLGIAVDDGAHLVHRFYEEGGNLIETLTGTGRSVILTSMTNIAAFGTLAFSTHQGLRSLCFALCIGVFCALVVTLTVLPVLLPVFSKSILHR